MGILTFSSSWAMKSRTWWSCGSYNTEVLIRDRYWAVTRSPLYRLEHNFLVEIGMWMVIEARSRRTSMQSHIAMWNLQDIYGTNLNQNKHKIASLAHHTRANDNFGSVSCWLGFLQQVVIATIYVTWSPVPPSSPPAQWQSQ